LLGHFISKKPELPYVVGYFDIAHFKLLFCNK